MNMINEVVIDLHEHENCDRAQHGEGIGPSSTAIVYSMVPHVTC